MSGLDGALPAGVDTDDMRVLHASLLAAERRAAMLAEVIEALSLSPDATILAQRAVELVGRAARADGAFVYLWDADRDLLVLRAATEGRQQRFVDKLTLRLGEGLTGWSALMRRPAVVHDDLLEDPRFVHIPSAMEADFRSGLVVPILVPGGDPVGVFSIYSTRPNVFTEQTVESIMEVAKLVASGIDRAAQFEVRTRQSKALHGLVGLAESPPRSTTAALAVIAERCLTIVPSNMCVVELADADLGGDDVVGVAVARSEQHRLAERTRETGTTDSATVHALLRAWEPRLETLSGPIRVAGRLIGTVACHRPSRFTGDDRLLLEAVSNYAALVLTGTAASGQSPFEEIVRSRHPARAEQLLVELGWAPKSLVTPFVVHIDPYQRLARHQALANATRVAEATVRNRVRRLVPGSPGLVAGLVLGAVVDADAQTALKAEIDEGLVGSGHQTTVVLGWGGPSADASGLIEGLRAANDAATWASVIRAPDGVLSHKHTSLMRSVGGLAYDRQDDLARARLEVARVAQSDQETGSALLETLRAHVECHGSAADAAKRLYIHRNTMRQRLDKLEKLISIPLDTPEGWLITRLALLVHDRESEPRTPR